VLEDESIRPPVIAAGINLFGGPLGLIHRHVTGAIPIRRNMKDPAYLITLKAYVAEILQRHDLLFYIEGGRSYSGELKSPKTGLLHAALQAEVPNLLFVPCAVAYDLVLEDHILARQQVKRQQRAFARELTEMVRYAVGYKSRAFVTYGEPIDASARDAHDRSDVLELAHHLRDVIGRLMKVLPTSIVAAAMRPSIRRADLEGRVSGLIETLSKAGANLETRDARAAVDSAARLFAARGVIVAEGGTYRVRDRNVLRYYARTITHLLPVPPSKAH
jgi:glycerol-3-phosphate O-acyltransferase